MKDNEKNLYTIQLGEFYEMPNTATLALRVPGGWVFASGGENGRTSTFVPYNEEFKSAEATIQPAEDANKAHWEKDDAYKRFFVDERAGCIAVRDREKTNPSYQGLHADTPGVVHYWFGLYDEKGKTWSVKADDLKSAHEMAARLNTRKRSLELTDEEVRAILAFLCANVDQSMTMNGFWDCDCEHDFQHRKEESHCKKCHATAGDSPDSIAIELLRNHLITD